MKRRILLIFTAAFALNALPVMAAAPKPPAQNQAGTGFSFSDWHVSTNEFEYDWQSGKFNAPTHVTLTRPGSSIQADRAFGNRNAKQATLTGHVVLHDDSGVLTSAGSSGSHAPATLTCDNLTIDGASKTYIATGNVYFSQGGSEVHADRAVMNGVTHDIHLYGSPGHPVQLIQ